MKEFRYPSVFALMLLSAVAFSLMAQNGPMTWRGLLLDSGRQYQTIQYLQSLIDSMAVRKMNVFHWHLTENDGWRMELKCAPKLTQVGAFVANGKEQHGFYSRSDMEHIVAYAAERGITVVPEIDLPGHSGALIAAYPEFACSKEVVCPANTKLVPFLKEVLNEVCKIFPSPYIHLGGDEVNHHVWHQCEDCQRLMLQHGIASEAELQVWFERQLIEYLAEKGRKVILWEDVLYETTNRLPDNLIIQWWNYRSKGELGLREALRRNIPVICSSNYYCYLNFPETPWAGYGVERTFRASDVEQRNPSLLLFDASNPLMLGMEACIWTDYNLTQDMLNARLFPRLNILARQMHSPSMCKLND